MDDPNDTTGELAEQVARIGAADDVLEWLRELTRLEQLVREAIERAEIDAVRAGQSIAAVARARGISRQYMSRRAARVTA